MQQETHPQLGDAPETNRLASTEALHGVEIDDPYRWLENGDDEEVISWTRAQHAYTRRSLDSLPNRAAIGERVSRLLRVNSVDAPIRRKNRYFFSERRAQENLHLICCRELASQVSTVLVDPHVVGKDDSASADLLDVSPTGRFIAYALRRDINSEPEVHVLEVDGVSPVTDRLPQGRYFGCAFRHDGAALYYAVRTARGPLIFLHRFGHSYDDDVEIFGRDLPKLGFVSFSQSHDGEFMLVHATVAAGQELATSVHLLDLASGTADCLIEGIGAGFQGYFGGSHIFFLTDWGAPTRRVLRANLHEPKAEFWEEIVPAGDAVIERICAAAGKLFVTYLENVVSRVAVLNPDGKHVRDLFAPSLGTISDVRGSWLEPDVYYPFSSFHVPMTVFRYDVERDETTQWSKLDMQLDHELALRQIWYESTDGTKIPMFLLHRKGLRADVNTPLLLNGYGGFGISNTPWFRHEASLWAEMGGVYAVANIRGGGEFGEAWHIAGTVEGKQQVFNDFISAAEWLIDRGYTTPEHLGIIGGSNGGLLIGAMITQRPDLFRAAICRHPLLDMLRFHRLAAGSFAARWWLKEFGSPDDPEHFRLLHAYSPYHNVRCDVDYPAVLVSTGERDRYVAPAHARKMVAVLQACTTSRWPVLLRSDPKAGHKKMHSTAWHVENATDELAFLRAYLGLDAQSPTAAPDPQVSVQTETAC